MIIGLDLSLARPAACHIPRGWEPGDWAALDVASWPSKKSKDSPENATEAERARWQRVAVIAEQVTAFVKPHKVSYVVVEGYAFGMHSSSVTALAELRGAVCMSLLGIGVVPVPVNISTCRKLLLGKLPSRRKGEPPPAKGAAKAAVQEALYKMGASFTNDDECDAFCCANLALSDMGHTAVTAAGQRCVHENASEARWRHEIDGED